MSDSHAPVGLLLAAGAARRYGSAKLAEPLPDGTPLIRHAALAALATCRDVHVVIGGHRDAVLGALEDLPVILVEHADWRRGLGSSIARGAQAVMTRHPDADVLLMLGDQPRVDASALARIVASGRDHRDAIVVADHGATRGPPCRFPARLLPELARLDGDDGARAVVRAYADTVVAVAMPEAAHDIDTPDDYRRVTALR